METRPAPADLRQAERTFGLAADALAKDDPDGLPSADLAGTCDDLLETSVPEKFKDASDSLAVDWTDIDSFSRPPPARGGPCADPEASWGHRKNNLLRSENELFYGYYLSAAVMMPAEHGPAVPELARRATLSSCRHNPVRALVPVLTAMPQAGIGLGDILADSGYAHRDAAAWALPLRAAGASLVQDLHPHDRGPKGTHDGAIIANGNLYCPKTPRPLLELGPLTRSADPANKPPRTTRSTAELARYKLGRLTRDDADGYHRVACPAAMGKIRCPLRPASMTLDRDRPEILSPPGAPPGLLHPADHHRPARGHRQDRAETRLPLRRAPPVLRPPHRRRTRLRHRQGPRHQRHQPRLVPPDGPGAPDAVHHHPADRPQPADPRRMGRPARRKPAPRRRRPPPQNPAPPPQDPRQPRRWPALDHRTHTNPRPRHPDYQAPRSAPACPATQPSRAQKATRQARTAHDMSSSHGHEPQAHRNVRPKRENRPH